MNWKSNQKCSKCLSPLSCWYDRGRCQPQVRTNLSLKYQRQPSSSWHLDLDLKLITRTDRTWLHRQTSFHLSRIYVHFNKLDTHRQGWEQIRFKIPKFLLTTKYSIQQIHKSQWITGSEHKSEKFQQYDNSCATPSTIRQSEARCKARSPAPTFNISDDQCSLGYTHQCIDKIL